LDVDKVRRRIALSAKSRGRNMAGKQSSSEQVSSAKRNSSKPDAFSNNPFARLLR